MSNRVSSSPPLSPTSPIIATMHANTGSSTSAKQREGLPSDSPRPVAPQKSEKYPPRYGAQHRQDALWEGGNEALPPGWRESRTEGDDQARYWNDALFMSTEHRPLPGVRLGEKRK
ncbi:hypothetical protein CY34DRAFT_812872 [Suillus luteus UH-Slu-Lm8-n1]|uniref:WW domain-containing protein n=1 Tax=Suillus luteus UH-Slu-Lm8-n1 TaxID=930992 RepID=A0A0C9ZAE8_9AGAM|nr:hypothetical protein CY34DRAFT_812872 [Suillus luteus UH-Slu-Lm8-n1]